MDHYPGNWGKPRDLFLPTKHTQQPIVTGTSVLGIKFKDGIMLSADTLASYGSLAQTLDMERLHKFGEYTAVGASGDMSDWQEIQHIVNDLLTEEYQFDDEHSLDPLHIYEYLAKIMYARRSKSDPLWNSLVVGGFKDGEAFLGYVDYQGTTYKSSTIATGFGAYLAQPLLRKQVEGREDELTEEEAIKLLDDCNRVLFYRDARSLNKIQRATITARGVEITQPYSLDTEWGFAENIRGYGAVYD